MGSTAYDFIIHRFRFRKWIFCERRKDDDGRRSWQSQQLLTQFIFVKCSKPKSVCLECPRPYCSSRTKHMAKIKIRPKQCVALNAIVLIRIHLAALLHAYIRVAVNDDTVRFKCAHISQWITIAFDAQTMNNELNTHIQWTTAIHEAHDRCSCPICGSKSSQSLSAFVLRKIIGECVCVWAGNVLWKSPHANSLHTSHPTMLNKRQIRDVNETATIPQWRSGKKAVHKQRKTSEIDSRAIVTRVCFYCVVGSCSTRLHRTRRWVGNFAFSESIRRKMSRAKSLSLPFSMKFERREHTEHKNEKTAQTK